MPHRYWTAGALTLCLTASTAGATVVVAETVEEMTLRSDLVVRAAVGQSMPALDQHSRRIWTWTELLITETLKGSPRQTLVVKQPGGAVGRIGQMVSGSADFSPGEDCLLFLEAAADEPDVFVVRGLSAGKIRLEKRLGRLLAVRHLDGIAFAHPGANSRLERVGPSEVLGLGEMLLQRVRRAASVPQLPTTPPRTHAQEPLAP